MSSIKLIRIAKAGYLILAALFCAMGIGMLVRPESAVDILGWGAGAAFAAFGCVRIIGYCSRDLYRLAFQNDPAVGVLAILLGMVLVFRRNLAVNALCLVLGVEMVTDNLLKVQTALDARRFGLSTWWLMLALAILTASAGALLIACPFQEMAAMVRAVGVALVSQGVLSFCVALCAINAMARPRRNVAA